MKNMGCYKKSQLRVSKALKISILKGTLPPNISLESMVMAFEVIPIQSLMCRPFIKPFLLGETVSTSGLL